MVEYRHSLFLRYDLCINDSNRDFCGERSVPVIEGIDELIARLMKLKEGVKRIESPNTQVKISMNNYELRLYLNSSDDFHYKLGSLFQIVGIPNFVEPWEVDESISGKVSSYIFGKVLYSIFKSLFPTVGIPDHVDEFQVKKESSGIAEKVLNELGYTMYYKKVSGKERRKYDGLVQELRK